MTSAKYLSSWIKEAGRGHVVSALSWGGFFIYTVTAVFGLHVDSSYFVFGIGNENLLYLCIGLGVLVAAAGFWYLEQPVKLDFYYSLPVKRGTVFWCRYVHGVLNVILSLAVSMMICGIYECSVDKGFLMYASSYTFRSFLVSAAVFFIFYHITIVSFLAGGRFAAVLFFFVLIVFSGQMVFQGIGRSYAQHFFKTFYRIPLLDELKEMLTPVLLSKSLAGTSFFNKREVLEYVPGRKDLSAAVLWILLSVLLTLYLEKKRKVENVGKMFAFSMAERAAVFFLSVSIALCLGNIFMGCGILLVIPLHILLEMPAGRRSRPAGRKWQMLAEGMTVALVTGGFAAGAGVFDSFLPDKDVLGAVRICVNGIDMTQREYAENVFGKENYATDRKLEKYSFTEGGLAEGVLWLRSIRENEKIETEPYTFVTVCYQMKNGKERYRVYPVNEEEFQAFSAVFETKEYKEKAYPALLWENVGDSRFTWKDGVRNSQVLKLTSEEKEEFLKLYKEEVLAFSMEELRTEAPAGIVEMKSDKWGEMEELLIYPFFEKTYGFLLDHGEIKEDLSDYPVRSLRVMNMNNGTEDMAGGILAEHYETEEELAEWKGRLVWEELDVQPLLYPLNTGKEIEVEVEEPESGALVKIKCYEKK